MKLTVKFYAGLDTYLPAGAGQDGVNIDVTAQMTPNRVIDRFNVPRDRAHLVLLNGVYLKPEERDTPQFRDGDTLAIWPPVAGGGR